MNNIVVKGGGLYCGKLPNSINILKFSVVLFMSIINLYVFGEKFEEARHQSKRYVCSELGLWQYTTCDPSHRVVVRAVSRYVIIFWD